MRAMLSYEECGSRLCVLRTLPLNDILGSSHLHLFSWTFTISKTTQFCFVLVSSSRKTPRYLSPPFFQVSLSGLETDFTHRYPTTSPTGRAAFSPHCTVLSAPA